MNVGGDVTALGSFDIYLERFLRWNSWDIVTDPNALFTDIWGRVLDPTQHPHAIIVSLLLSGFLFVAYVVVAMMQSEPIQQRSDS